MRYIVGLDFGTHQTKVCIEDTLNRHQFQYEFLEFPNVPMGSEATLFPSIVQINKDETVSYGFINPTLAKVIANEDCLPPVLKEIPEPMYESLPIEPKYKSLSPKPKSKHHGPFAVLAYLLPKSE